MAKRESKTVEESRAVMSELVFQRHANLVGYLMGGQLMHWMDAVSFICARRHAQQPCVTISVDQLSFHQPIRVGDLVRLEARLTRAFTTSMEIFVHVDIENLNTGERAKSNTGFFTFVALNQEGRPARVPELVPKTEQERQLYEEAWQRREHRIDLSKRP